jgi:hypothetical protein
VEEEEPLQRTGIFASKLSPEETIVPSAEVRISSRSRHMYAFCPIMQIFF